MSLAQDPFQELSAAAPVGGESDFNLAEYLGMVRRHWRLVAAFLVTAVTASVIHYSITPKEYQARAVLKIERRSLASPMVGEQNIWMDYFNQEFYPTQYELLQSRGLAERVVRNLDLPNDSKLNPAAALRRAREARPPSAEEDEATLGHLAEGLRGGLAVEPVRNTQLVALLYRSPSPELAARIANGFAEAFIDLGIEDRFATAGKASSFLGVQIETLKQEIQDKEVQLQAFRRRSDIIAVDPSSNVLLQRLESLNQDYMELKKLRIEKEARYHEVLTAPRETVADSLSGGVVSDLRAQQLRLEREYETQLKTYKPEWPAMVALKAEIEKGEQSMERVVAEMVGKAQASAKAEYQTALRQEQALGAELAKQKSETIDQSSATVEYSNLQVEVQTRRELLDELMRKQSETEVSARLQNSRDSNVRIVDRALVPGGPFRPSLRQDLTYGALLGLLLGIGCALLIEFLDRTVKTPEEVERRLGLSTLGVIPDLSEEGRGYGLAGSGYGYGYGETEGTGRVRTRPGKAAPAGWLEKKKGPAETTPAIELVPHERPRTPISEAYRSLRTALLLSSAQELRVIAVTSAGAAEGKTATASNLAVVLAQLGRRVLIVDCDLRKPRIHQVFRVSNRLGLVTQLTGAEGPAAESAIFPTEVPSLWCAPSGPIPPNPSELLASDRMREWLKAARARFDFIILDTPPALPVTDATIVGALADGVVLTLRTGKVTREEARACRDRLRMAEVKVLGVVLNRFRSGPSRLAKRYRYYESYGSYEAEAQAGSAA